MSRTPSWIMLETYVAVLLFAILAILVLALFAPLIDWANIDCVLRLQC